MGNKFLNTTKNSFFYLQTLQYPPLDIRHAAHMHYQDKPRGITVEADPRGQ